MNTVKRTTLEPGNRRRGFGRSVLGKVFLTSTIASVGSYAMAQDTQGETVLDTIVVTASGFEQNVKDAPASITVVTREELEKGSFRDLTDALREVQGVAVTGVANEKDIHIRGLPGSYTLVLVDGRRQSTREARPNGSSGIEQSFIPPVAAIERIEIVRGPMSSLYGSDAMGGVINIITRKVSDQWSGSVTTEGTLQQHSKFGDSGQVSFYANGPILKDRLGLQIWGRGYRRGSDDLLDGTQGAKEGDLNGRLTFTPHEDHDIYLEGGISRLRRLSEPGRTIDIGDAESYRDFDRKHWSISHTGRWGPTTSEFSLQQEWGSRESWEYDSVTGGFERAERVPRVRNTILDGKFTTPFDALGEHTLVTGGQFKNSALTDQGHTGVHQSLSIDQWAFFVEDEWRIVDDFALTGGLRYDDHEIYGGHISPRIYGVWNTTSELTIKGGVSTGFRAPDIRNIAPGYYMPTQRGAGLIAPNPDLEPETSTNYEIGAVWDNGDLILGATYFYTDFQDKISNANTNRLVNPSTGSIIDPLGGAACNNAALAGHPGYSCLWQNFNIDDAVIQGVELTATWHATADLTFRGSYTYTHSEQKTGDYAGFPLARTPEHMASLRADWVTPVEGLEAWASVNYHGEEIHAGARVGDNGSVVTINDQTGRKYDAYTTLDLGAKYDFGEGVAMNAAVYNVFDKDVGIDDYNTVVEGRRFWLSVTKTF